MKLSFIELPALLRATSISLLLIVSGAQFAHAARTTTYFHTDHLGSVVAASNDAGALLWRKEYAPFGAQLDSTAEDEKLAYTGKEHDDVLGLTYFGARHYDPMLGRFMGLDPVGFVEANPFSFNRYAYVSNNPYRYIDPDGLEKLEPQEARKKYAVGKGHHWVPFGVFDKNLDLSAEARETFGAAISGEPLPKRIHEWGDPHQRYNDAVKQHFQDYVKKHKINPAKMTAEQAAEFVEHIRNTPDPNIRPMVSRIDKYMSRSKRTRALVRGIAFVPGLAAIADILTTPSPERNPICQTGANVDGC